MNICNLFKTSNTPSLFYFNKVQIDINMYKKVYGNNIQDFIPQHNYSIRNRDNILIPRHKLTIYQHSLSYSGPNVWNSVLDNIKNRLYKLYINLKTISNVYTATILTYVGICIYTSVRDYLCIYVRVCTYRDEYICICVYMYWFVYIYYVMAVL